MSYIPYYDGHISNCAGCGKFSATTYCQPCQKSRDDWADTCVQKDISQIISLYLKNVDASRHLNVLRKLAAHVEYWASNIENKRAA